MGERGLTLGHGGSLWGFLSRHQGQEVARGCGLPAPGGAHPLTISTESGSRRPGRDRLLQVAPVFCGEEGADRGSRGVSAQWVRPPGFAHCAGVSGPGTEG